MKNGEDTYEHVTDNLQDLAAEGQEEHLCCQWRGIPLKYGLSAHHSCLLLRNSSPGHIAVPRAGS